MFCQSTNGKRQAYLQSIISKQPQPHIILRSLPERTKDLQILGSTQGSLWWDKVERACQVLDAHADAVNAGVQSQGAPVAFAWASIRLLLRVGFTSHKFILLTDSCSSRQSILRLARTLPPTSSKLSRDSIPQKEGLPSSQPTLTYSNR